MNDLHIDDFCKDTAKVFLQLFKTFPVKSALYVEDICGPDEPDEFGLHSPRFQACFSSIIWLADAGYLQYTSTIQQDAFEDTVLTRKGFNFLTTFDAEFLRKESMQSRIEIIHTTLTKASSEKLKDLILGYIKADM